MKREWLFPLLALGCIACKPTHVTPVSPPPVSVRATPPPGLLFFAYDGDPIKTPLAKMSFQIGWPDKSRPAEFLQIGDGVPSTKFRILAFNYKTGHNPRTGEEDDASELTLANSETNETFVVPLRATTDSPPVF